MRTILIAAAAAAVLVAAGVWYGIDQGLLGTAEDEAVTAERPAVSDDKAPDTDSARAPAAADDKPAVTEKAPATADDEPAADKPSTDKSTLAVAAPSDSEPKSAEPQTAAQPTPTPTPTAEPEQPEPPELAFDVVRIGREGTAVLAGRGPPGATITLRRDDEEIASVTADALGEWVIVLEQPLPEGPGVFGLTAKTPDDEEHRAPATLAVDVPPRPKVPATAVARADDADDAKKPAQTGALAVLVPDDSSKPSKIMQKPPAATKDTPDVTVDKVDYDESGNVVVAGTAAPESTVRLYVDNKPVGDTRTDDRGEWTLKPDDPIATGQHTLRADRVVEGGKVAARVEIPFDRAPRRDILKIAAHRRVIVQPGNSLWRISRRVYGSGMQYTVIYSANATQIRDPDMIYPGQIFDLPNG